MEHQAMLYVGTTDKFDATNVESIGDLTLELFTHIQGRGISVHDIRTGIGEWDGEPDPHIVIRVEGTHGDIMNLASRLQALTGNECIMVLRFAVPDDSLSYRVRREDTEMGNRTLYGDKYRVGGYGFKYVPHPYGNMWAALVHADYRVTSIAS